jgi:hypothetical protein
MQSISQFLLTYAHGGLSTFSSTTAPLTFLQDIFTKHFGTWLHFYLTTSNTFNTTNFYHLLQL